MKAGRFTEKMTVQKKTHTVDSFGDEQEVWTDRYTSVWCQPLPIGSSAAGGGEYNDDDQLKADTKYEFVSRYLNGVEYTDRIYWSGGYFDIYQIFPVGRREGMRIRAAWSDNQDDGFAVGSVVTADPVVAGTGYTVSELIAAKDAAEAAEAAAVVAMNDAIAAQEAAEAAQAVAEAAQADAEADEAAALAAQANAEAARDAALAAQAAAEAAQATAEILQAAAQATADAALAALVVAQNDLAACEAELEQAELDLAAAQQAEADALTALGVAQHNEANALADLAIAEAERDEALQDELAAQAEQAAAEAARDAALADAGTAAADLAACEATLSTTQATLATAQADLAACEAALSTAQADLATCEADLASAEAARDAALASIASLEADAGITIAEVEAQYEYNDTGKSLEYLVDEYNGVPHSLLDDYSGAAAAYSLRRLDSTYTGPAVRVVRASDLEEMDIYFEADGSLDISTLEAFCSGTSGTVKVWYDQSGLSHDAEQTTAAAQPTIVDTRTNLFLQSNQFDTSWVLGGSPTLTSGYTGYDGSQDAWKLVTASGENIYQSVSPSGVNTFSFYVRGDGSTGVRMYLDGPGGDADVFFNLNTGSVVSTSSATINETIEAITGIPGDTTRWYRISLTFYDDDTASGPNQNVTRCRLYTTANTATNAAGTIYIQDAQLEAGSVATEYIPTSGSAVTVGEVVTENAKAAMNLTDGQGFTMTSAIGAGADKYSFLVHAADSSDTSWSLYAETVAGYVTPLAEDGSTSTLLQSSPYDPLNAIFKDGSALTLTTRDALHANYVSAGQSLTTMHFEGSPGVAILFNRNGGRNYTGTVQELIFYTSDQDSNRVGIEANINEHYGIYDQPLLDQYSGAAAAYSLRRLSDDYTGPAVRVVRASDLAEADIYFEADGTLDVTALEAFCHGTSGTVKVWYDQSGLSNHAEQTTAAAQPTIVDTRTNLLLQSNQFDTTWTLDASMTLTSGQSGYDGSSDAWLVEKTAIQFRALRQAPVHSDVVTFSVYAKQGTLRYLNYYSPAGNAPQIWFDLQAGVVGTKLGTYIEVKMESVGGGWYRCSVTYDAASGGEVRIYPQDLDGSYGSVAGNIYIQDAQLEAGSVATEYIPTSGSAVTVGEVVTENGLPALDFDGVNSYMDAADVTTTQPTTVSFVATGDTANDYFFDGDDVTDRQAAFSSSGVYSAYAGVTQSTGVSFVAGLQINMFALFDDTDGALYLNGAGSEPKNMGIRALSGLVIGQRYSATGRLDGRFQELILWSADHSSDRTSIEANVNDYYTIYT